MLVVLYIREIVSCIEAYLKAGVKMAIKESQKKALRKYKEKAYDRLEISVPKGFKADVQNHAAGRKESINGFVNRAIREAIERDNCEDTPQ